MASSPPPPPGGPRKPVSDPDPLCRSRVTTRCVRRGRIGVSKRRNEPARARRAGRARQSPRRRRAVRRQRRRQLVGLAEDGPHRIRDGAERLDVAPGPPPLAREIPDEDAGDLVTVLRREGGVCLWVLLAGIADEDEAPLRQR